MTYWSVAHITHCISLVSVEYLISILHTLQNVLVYSMVDLLEQVFCLHYRVLVFSSVVDLL